MRKLPALVTAGLMGVFGILSLLLSALGVYGVMSYSVAQRTREFGIRMALGALPGSVLRMVARQALAMACAGVAVGLPVAFLLTRLMHGFIFGLQGVPAGVMVTGAVLLGVSALVASWVPARAATRVDPVTALRAE